MLFPAADLWPRSHLLLHPPSLPSFQTAMPLNRCVGPKISLQRRRVRFQSPLFDGYVFLFGTEDEKVCCRATNRVVQVLPVAD
jgi:hypothetical protein